MQDGGLGVNPVGYVFVGCHNSMRVWLFIYTLNKSRNNIPDIKYADTFCNAMLHAISTIYGTTPKLRLYGGTEPADEAASVAGDTAALMN
jgi:hypothetical protein